MRGRTHSSAMGGVFVTQGWLVNVGLSQKQLPPNISAECNCPFIYSLIVCAPLSNASVQKQTKLHFACLGWILFLSWTVCSALYRKSILVTCLFAVFAACIFQFSDIYFSSCSFPAFPPSLPVFLRVSHFFFLFFLSYATSYICPFFHCSITILSWFDGYLRLICHFPTQLISHFTCLLLSHIYSLIVYNIL